jgi:RNA recognition motif-containing protein
MSDKDSQTQTAPETKDGKELTPEELAKQKEAEWARREAAFQAQQAEREYQKTNTKLFLSNLPRNYRKGDIENLCQRYGTITQVIINSEKRFAFVTFSSREDAQYALYDLAEKQVGGQPVRVSWSKPSEKDKAVTLKEAETAVRAQKAQTDQTKPQAGQNKPQAGEAASAAKGPNAGKDGAAATPAPVPEVEKPRFAAQQKPVAKKTPQPVQPPQKAAPAKQAQKQGANQPAQKKGPAPKQNPPKQAGPQKFRVTVQNETAGGEIVSLSSISFEDWQKYICPLFENYKFQMSSTGSHQ